MISSRLLWSKSLLTMYALAPTSTPYSRSDCEPSAVTSTTGSSLSFWSARIFAVSSKPFMRGMSTSVTTRSNGSVLSRVSASRPSTVATTS